MWSSEEELEIQRYPRKECDTSTDAAAARLIARLAPNTGGNDQRQYIRCEVIIMVPSGYPGDPEHPVTPQVRINASSGLTDARRAALLAALEDVIQGDLSGLPGMLPAVLEAAQERLTGWNDEGPVGYCSVCLAGLDHGEDASKQTDVSTAASLLRLPCYHVLHAACFAQVWEAEWLRQKESSQRHSLTMEAHAAITISETVVACPECRQVVPWAAVPQIHPFLEHLLFPVPIEKIAVGSVSDHDASEAECEESARAEEAEIVRDTLSSHSPKQGREASSRLLRQPSAPARVDLFEVIMPRGLRTRLKPKWDARDHEGPILRNGACGVVAEFMEGKDATYLRPEGTDYWLPLHGGRNNCKMVRIDQDMLRPQKAPSGWIHGDDSLGTNVLAPSSLGGAKTASADVIAASSPKEGKASVKERKKKTKNVNAGGGYACADKLLCA